MRRKILTLICAGLCIAALHSPLLSAPRECGEFPYEEVSQGWKFPEGPAFDAEGNLYAVAYKKFADIGRVTPDGRTEVFMDLEAMGEGAANGMAWHPDNKLYACEYEGRRIIEIDLDTKQVKTVVDSWQGKPLNEVNDIYLHPSGTLYFTDPYREDATGGGRVFAHDLAENRTYLLVEGLAFPNGLTVSADKKTLYVAQTVRRNITAWPLADNGHRVAGEGREIFLMEGGNGPDGIEVDGRGNLWVTHYGAGRLYYITPEGELISCFTGFGSNTTNVELHGEWVYITEPERGHIVRVRRSHFTE